jgi:hypothetical protein
MTIVVTQTNTTTAQQVIRRAMRLIGVLGIGETLAADEAADGLAALNSMLDSWSVEKTMLYAFETVSYAPTSESFTVGPSGDLVTNRPIKILSAYMREGGIDTPVDVVERQVYERIAQKDADGSVRAIYYRPDYPNGTVYCWPVATSGQTLYLSLQQPLTEFTSLTEALSMPPGYREALTFNLAVFFAPEFEKEASPTVKARAVNTLRTLRRGNLEIAPLGMPAGIPDHSRSNILEG